MRITEVRLLDPIRSIKAKLAVLVAGSVIATSFFTWYGLVILGLYFRYTLPVAVVASLALTQILAHGMTAPLRQMTAAARAMADGQGPIAIVATSRDEVGDLARAFTAMAQDVAKVEVQRRDLLANIGHELRTPLAALRAQTENLVDGVQPADGETLGELLTEVERLGALVDDLLDLATADAGVSRLDRRPVDLIALAEQVARQLRAASPGHVIELSGPPALLWDVDPRRMTQVLSNLVDNATRHGPAAGKVTVALAVTGQQADGTGGQLLIDVADEGPGIPAGERRAVFERFHRGDTSGGGTGLGLAIARWAVTLHGGLIEIVPVPAGSVFRVTIPSYEGDDDDR